MHVVRASSIILENFKDHTLIIPEILKFIELNTYKFGLVYNFSSFCPILFKFKHTLTIRQCMFCRKIGAKGSVLQELCHLIILTKMFSIVLIVHTL